MRSPHELDTEITISRAIAAARGVWGTEWTPTRAAIAPGRIEILGNHVDYNGGPVLAAAIDRATIVLSDDSEEFAVHFADLPELGVVQIDPGSVAANRVDAGTPQAPDYILGVVARASERGRQVSLGRAVVATSVPIGSGMSSSAALCVALTLLLNSEPPAGAELVYDAQAAEHWAGVPCGTMDQSASVFGQVIRYEGPERVSSIAPQLDGFGFVVVDSRVERSLGTSSYADRVRECGESVAMLEQFWNRPLGNLAALSLTDMRTIETEDPPLLPSPLLERTRHIVTEISRVEAGERALQARDWQEFGALMNASGESSARDYAISHPTVEEMVAAMRLVPGVLGARMMGGGEGGAALALLELSAIEAFREAMAAFFGDDSLKTGIRPLTFAPGARLLAAEQLSAPAQ